ncbi:eukaryotic translation initiation factor 4E type 2 isoform X1 [Stegastes partitus]|uniref:Eukaryotic translation initiation factor 4E type 2 n=1 Tax=Stegastes partitus TaxID=144197 RepID=A0A9Y4JVL7_9TELE|nr:PREDICTED: eukaryotic translation initiation factor 4E type 2 isoform X1 [Stegastes partitus]
MNNKFDALKDDDSGDHDQDQGSPKDGEKEKTEDEDKEQNTSKKKMVVPGAGEHPLQYNYTFWYSRRTPGRPASTQSYEQNIKQIGSFASVEQFWRFYSHMIRPGDLTGHSDFHLFKEGIKPMWEDDANKMGGKWIIRLRKGLASRCWENLILAMLGEQFMVGEEICGAVVSVRFQEDIISIWNKTASDQATTARIRDTLRRVLNLPPNTIMEYKTHTDSIKYVCLLDLLFSLQLFYLFHTCINVHAQKHFKCDVLLLLQRAQFYTTLHIPYMYSYSDVVLIN